MTIIFVCAAALVAIGFAFGGIALNDIHRTEQSVQKLREDIGSGKVTGLTPTDVEIFYVDGEPIAVKGKIEGKYFSAALKPKELRYSDLDTNSL